MKMSRAEKLVRWCMFSVLIALAPLAASYFSLQVDRREPSLEMLLGRGELLLICATIAAAAIGELIPTGREMPVRKLVAGGSCMAVVVASSRYFADMSRTVIRGTPSPELKKLYQTVLDAQEEAITKIRDGADGMKIHRGICDRFEKAGYKTGLVNGRMQGYFHGTGHGVGLDIHEAPRISRTGSLLLEGHVVTVEPGLYYPGLGAVRIEDMVLVTADGCRNLTNYPKTFELD